MDKIRGMEAFVAAVEEGSFTAAGTRLGLSQQQVAKQVANLEAHLKAGLLQRTTRRQRLTPLGERYYQRCKQILRDIDAAEALSHELEQSLSGSLRLGAARTFGIFGLMPFIEDFMTQYPSVDIELSLNDQRHDLLAEGIDAAFRIGPIWDETLIARPLSPFRLLPCAAPAYLRRHGEPQVPKDLSNHHCLDYRFATPAEPNIWVFEDPQGTSHPVAVTSRLRVNESQALLQAALAGHGVTMAPEIMVRPYLATGELVALLRNYQGPSRALHFVYRPDRYRTRVMRALIDGVMAWFGAEDDATCSGSGRQDI